MSMSSEKEWFPRFKENLQLTFKGCEAHAQFKAVERIINDCDSYKDVSYMLLEEFDDDVLTRRVQRVKHRTKRQTKMMQKNRQTVVYPSFLRKGLHDEHTGPLGDETQRHRHVQESR